jgi:hypothetical protein
VGGPQESEDLNAEQNSCANLKSRNAGKFTELHRSISTNKTLFYQNFLVRNQGRSYNVNACHSVTATAELHSRVQRRSPRKAIEQNLNVKSHGHFYPVIVQVASLHSRLTCSLPALFCPRLWSHLKRSECLETIPRQNRGSSEDPRAVCNNVLKQ